MDRTAHILIVEDEVKLAEVLAEYLLYAGYAVDCLHDGSEVLPWLAQNRTDLVVLDLSLPGMDGIELCNHIRRQSAVPVLMATARVAEDERLTGLESGADDYVCKPYSMREMVARVKAILRRSAMPAFTAAPPTPAPLRVDESAMEIYHRGLLLELTPVEFRLLNHFISHPRTVFSRDELMNAIYKDYRLVSYRTVDSHIKNLRKKLSADDSQEMICSVYGEGYRFEPPQALAEA